MRESYKKIILEPAKSRIARGECPACGKPKSEWNRRTDWTCCSEKCTREYQDLYEIIGQSDFRSKCLRRDKYACQKCGGKPIRKYPSGNSFPDESKLIVDHIKSIALGGDQWDMDNAQTLCIECDKKKTSRDLRIIAKHKLIKGQKKLAEFI